ncbi:MAG: LPS export ABC transporter permease LptF [Pontibacterium sp.]
MIISRYLSREIFSGMAAVTGVLLLIIVSGRFISFLGKAAGGDLSSDVLAEIMFYLIPSFLELLLPLGLFLGILLGYGRLYLESEMVVLNAAGVSDNTLIKIAFGPGIVTLLLTAFVTLWAAPTGNHEMMRVLDEQKKRSQLETLSVGRFQVSKGEHERVTYTDALSDDGVLGRVFIAEKTPEGMPVVIMAESGQKTQSASDGVAYLVLENGNRYEGEPGRADYKVAEYASYGARLDEPDPGIVITKTLGRPTAALLGSADPDEQAHLHWRLSLPILVVVVTLLAVPLSRVNPRQGRYAKLLPAILIYLAYVTLLSTMRSQISNEQTGVWAMYAVHFVFMLLAVFLRQFVDFWGGLIDKLFTLVKKKSATGAKS